MSFRLFSLASILLLAACGGKSKQSADSGTIRKETAVEAAKKAAQEAFATLSGELATAMAEGGPVEAVEICSTKAPKILEDLSRKRSLEIARLSDHARNPLSMAQGADLEVIQAFRESIGRGESPAPDVREGAAGSLTVRLPIVLTQPLCLQCHGSESDIAPETREMIRTLYPSDLATGYQLNNLRGIWRISVPRSSAR